MIRAELMLGVLLISLHSPHRHPFLLLFLYYKFLWLLELAKKNRRKKKEDTLPSSAMAREFLLPATTERIRWGWRALTRQTHSFSSLLPIPSWPSSPEPLKMKWRRNLSESVQKKREKMVIVCVRRLLGGGTVWPLMIRAELMLGVLLISLHSPHRHPFLLLFLYYKFLWLLELA